MELEPPDFGRLKLSFRDASHGDRTRSRERLRASGALEQLRVGVLRDALPPLGELDRSERYREARLRFLDRVVAVGLTRRSSPMVFSHRTAIAILGLPSVGAWPATVDLIEPIDSARRSRRGVRVHRIGYAPEDITRWGPFFVTTAARTLADVARSDDFMASVVALDAALSPSAQPFLRVARSDVAEILARSREWGLARAETALRFADGRAANGGESASRVVIYQLGFEVPELQVRHFHEGGFYDVDFEWPPRPRRLRSLIGEFDGLDKYLKAEYLRSMSPGQAVLREKRREDVLRRQGHDFARWGWREVRHPHELARLLRDSGLEAIRRPLI